MIPVDEDFNDMGISLEYVLTGKQSGIVMKTAIISNGIADRQVIFHAHIVIIDAVPR